MGRTVSYSTYMNAVTEKVIDNTQQLKRSIHQRRNGMEDLYGVSFSAHATVPDGDGRYEAKFYLSLSTDYVYLHRFAFKFVIMPSVLGGSTPSTADDWKVTIGGVDITDYLKEQQDIAPTDPLFSGKGVYPSYGLEEDKVDNFYDILDVVSVLYAEGKDDDAYTIIRPRFKSMTISSAQPFSVDAYCYTKYSTVNR